MRVGNLLVQARRAAGISQKELARRGHTSRPTLSAYEHGRKSPTLQTAARLLAEAGFQLTISPQPTFSQRPTKRGRTVAVPEVLPRLAVDRALATVRLPLHLNWSAPDRSFDLRDRAERARAYEIVLREGTPTDVLTYIDGALLVDLWDELVLPRDVREAWAPVIDRAQVVA